MTEVVFTFSGETLAAFVKGKLRTIPRSHPGYEKLCLYLDSTTDHDEELVMEMIDMKTLISRLTAGKVKVIGDGVYYSGAAIHSALGEKLIAVLNAGSDAAPWAKFLDNVMKNPNDRSKECLYNFLEKNDTPLTEDGCFIAWKYVDENFRSMRASPDGTHMDHTPGRVVEMDRNDVDSNPEVSCSSGLHCCASPYLGGYNTSRRIVKVKVNPRDVCAVPTDYSFQKMRVCRYYVLEEVLSAAEIAAVDAQQVTHDVSHMDVVPDSVKDLPTMKNADEFNAMWARVDNDVEVGSLVAKAGHFLVGVVTASEEIFEEDGDYDDDGEWVEEDGELYWTYSVIWQDGMYEEIVIYSGQHNSFQRVEQIRVPINPIDVAEGLPAVYAAYVIEDDVAVGGVTAQTFHHKGKAYTARQLLNGVEAGGQRGYCRATGLKRSTLQVWLSKIDYEQIELDDADGVVVFKHKSGAEIEAHALVGMVQDKGQRAVSRLLGIPRSTLQGWLSSV